MLFKLSLPVSCAANCGVESPVLARANELVLLSARGEDLVAACASMSKNEEEDLEKAVSFPLGCSKCVT